MGSTGIVTGGRLSSLVQIPGVLDLENGGDGVENGVGLRGLEGILSMSLLTLSINNSYLESSSSSCGGGGCG